MLNTTLWRSMCSNTSTNQDRVIKAVKRYAAMRAEELSNDTNDTSADKDKMLRLLAGDVTAATKWDDLGFDDLDKVEVLLEVEDEFNHIIPDDDADRIGSVQESVEYLTRQTPVMRVWRRFACTCT